MTTPEFDLLEQQTALIAAYHEATTEEEAERLLDQIAALQTRMLAIQVGTTLAKETP